MTAPSVPETAAPYRAAEAVGAVAAVGAGKAGAGSMAAHTRISSSNARSASSSVSAKSLTSASRQTAQFERHAALHCAHTAWPLPQIATLEPRTPKQTGHASSKKSRWWASWAYWKRREMSSSGTVAANDVIERRIVFCF